MQLWIKVDLGIEEASLGIKLCLSVPGSFTLPWVVQVGSGTVPGAKPNREIHACNPSTQEPEAFGWRVWGYPRLHREVECSLGFIKLYLEKPNKTKQTNKNLSPITGWGRTSFIKQSKRTLFIVLWKVQIRHVAIFAILAKVQLMLTNTVHEI